MLTSGWRVSHARTFERQLTHCRRAGSGSVGTARENEHCERLSESACQRLARATTASAARQCTAWLSPKSTTVATAWAAGTPNQHTSGVFDRRSSVQRLLGVSSASFGDGVTL